MFVRGIMAQTNKPPTRGSDLMEPPPISALVIADSSATTKKSQMDHDNADAQENHSKKIIIEG
jgi:hypothetical protein